MASADLLDEPQTVAAAADTSESLYEEIDGQRVELPPMSTYAAQIINRLSRHLGAFADQHKFGEVFSEMLFALPLKTRQRNRRPDVAFVPFDRWSSSRPIDPTINAWPVVPSLVIEVVSPSDLAEELSSKIDEYFEAGVGQVWVIYPIARYAMVHTSLTEAHRVADSQPLDGGTILPGWALRLMDILPLTLPATPSSS